MVSITSSFAIVATMLLASLVSTEPTAVAAPAPSQTLALSALTPEGCYSSAGDLQFANRFLYQSSGNCQPICVGMGMAVMATTNSTDCWCGSELPPSSDSTDSSNCDDHCAGYGQEMCGGADATYFSFYLTGTDDSVGNSGGSSDTTTAAASTSSTSSSQKSSSTSVSSATTTMSVSPSIVTVGGQTIVVTAPGQVTPTASSTSSSKKSSSSNTAAIAAGVVVGVVAIASAMAGGFFYMRHRRRREIEEEYQRNAAVTSFVGNGKPTSSGGVSSINDTRLDPAVMAQRRMSDGSIADNQDYSRRILKVTNA